jgi:hypothetical protein
MRFGLWNHANVFAFFFLYHDTIKWMVSNWKSLKDVSGRLNPDISSLLSVVFREAGVTCIGL